MEINNYQVAALRTANKNDSKSLVLNGVLGLSGETGEVADILKKHLFQGHELDKDKMIDELGDVCWYIAITAEGLGVDLETVMKGNIEKLQKRYPEGFDADKSINRYDVNLDDKCRECKNLYSSMECEMCEDYDMFK